MKATEKEQISTNLIENNESDFSKHRDDCLRTTLISLFAFRSEENENDVPFFESLIQNKILSLDEIRKQLVRQQPFTSKTSLTLLMVISAFVDKMMSDETVMEMGTDYIRKQYPDTRKTAQRYINKGITKKEMREFTKHRSKEMCFMFETLLLCTDSSYSELIDGYWNYYKDIYFTPLLHKETRVLEVISKLIGYDFVEKPNLLERFISRRRNELIDYICADSECSADALEEEGYLDVAICASALGAGKKTSSSYLLPKKLVDLKFLQRRDINKNDLEIDSVFPRNRIFAGIHNDILADMLPELYSGAYVLETLTLMALQHKEMCQKIVYGCICSRLIDVASERLFDNTKEAVVKEEMVRNLAYSASECEIVLEKIKGVFLLFMTARLSRGELEQQMKEADLTHLSTLIKSPKGTTPKKGEEQNAVHYEAIVKKYHKTQKKLESVEFENEVLKSQNESLVEDNAKLTNQLSKESRATELIDELKQQIRELTSELEKYKKSAKTEAEEADEFEETISDQPAVVTTPSEEEIDMLLSASRFLIVCGRWEVTRALCELSPNSKLIRKAGDNNQDVKRFDAVLLFTDFANHGCSTYYLEQCRKSGTTFIYLSGSNMYQIKEKIYSVVKNNTDTKDGNANTAASQ